MPRKKRKSSEHKMKLVRLRIAEACRLIATGHRPGAVEASLRETFKYSASSAQKDMRDARETLKAEAAKEQEDLKAECFATLDEGIRQGFILVQSIQTGSTLTGSAKDAQGLVEERQFKEVSKPDLSAIVSAVRLKAQLGGIVVERHKVELNEESPEEAARIADDLRKRRENANARAQNQRGGNKGQPGSGKA